MSLFLMSSFAIIAIIGMLIENLGVVVCGSLSAIWIAVLLKKLKLKLHRHMLVVFLSR